MKLWESKGACDALLFIYTSEELMRESQFVLSKEKDWSDFNETAPIKPNVQSSEHTEICC